MVLWNNVVSIKETHMVEPTHSHSAWKPTSGSANCDSSAVITPEKLLK